MKYRLTTSLDNPMASKICAPVYEATVEMPILHMTFSTPLPSALISALTATSGRDVDEHDPLPG